MGDCRKILGGVGVGVGGAFGIGIRSASFLGWSIFPVMNNDKCFIIYCLAVVDRL